MMVRPLADALVPEKKLGVGRLSARGEEEPEGAPAVLAKELQDKCLYVNTVRILAKALQGKCLYVNTVRSWLVAVLLCPPACGSNAPDRTTALEVEGMFSRLHAAYRRSGRAPLPSQPSAAAAGSATCVAVVPPPAGLVDVPAVL